MATARGFGGAFGQDNPATLECLLRGLEPSEPEAKAEAGLHRLLLHIAARNGQQSIASQLCRMKCDVNAPQPLFVGRLAFASFCWGSGLARNGEGGVRPCLANATQEVATEESIRDLQHAASLAQCQLPCNAAGLNIQERSAFAGGGGGYFLGQAATSGVFDERPNSPFR